MLFHLFSPVKLSTVTVTGVWMAHAKGYGQMIVVCGDF